MSVLSFKGHIGSQWRSWGFNPGGPHIKGQMSSWPYTASLLGGLTIARWSTGCCHYSRKTASPIVECFSECTVPPGLNMGSHSYVRHALKIFIKMQAWVLHTARDKARFSSQLSTIFSWRHICTLSERENCRRVIPPQHLRNMAAGLKRQRSRSSQVPWLTYCVCP